MVSFFWQKGFYFNGQLFFFKYFTINDVFKTFGLSHRFLELWMYRNEGLLWSTINDLTYTKKLFYNTPKQKKIDLFEKNEKQTLIYLNPTCTALRYKTLSFSTLSPVNLILLNFYFLRTWPVLLDYFTQQRFNIFFYFFTRTYRGLSLRINKPLHQRTRHRTFCKQHLSKTIRFSKTRIDTSRWFKV